MDQFRFSMTTNIFKECHELGFTTSLRYDALLGVTVNQQSCLTFQLKAEVGGKTNFNSAWTPTTRCLQQLKLAIARVIFSDCWKFIQDVTEVKVEGMISIILDDAEIIFLRLDHKSSREAVRPIKIPATSINPQSLLAQVTDQSAVAAATLPQYEDNYEPATGFQDVDLIPDSEALRSMVEQTNPQSQESETMKNETKTVKPARQKRVKYERVNGKLVCPICRKHLSKSANMRVHIRKHTLEKPYGCSKCELKFVSKTSLNHHYSRIHLGLKFKCTICGRSYYNQTRLKDHMNIHSGANPYKCHICEKTFQSQEHLRKHVDLHLNKFHCDICDRSFVAGKHLARHMRLHENGVAVRRHKPRSDMQGMHITKNNENYIKRPEKKKKLKGVGYGCGKRVKYENNAEYVCDECDATCDSAAELMQHLMGHQESGSDNELNSSQDGAVNDASNMDTPSEDTTTPEGALTQIVSVLEGSAVATADVPHEEKSGDVSEEEEVYVLEETAIVEETEVDVLKEEPCE